MTRAISGVGIPTDSSGYHGLKGTARTRTTSNPANDAGGSPGANTTASCPRACSCSRVRTSRVTTPSTLGRKTSVKTAMRTGSARRHAVSGTREGAPTSWF